MSTNLLVLKQTSHTLSVLYVEDEQNLRESLGLFLKKIFDQVWIANDGKEGLSLYEQHQPDIVITDILMPHMNGIEMLKIIKEEHPNQHIIITSAYTESEFFVESIKMGVGSYIIKPVDYKQMIDVLLTVTLKINQEKELFSYHSTLEQLVEIKAKEYLDLQNTRVEDYEKILLALVKMIEQRDSYTAGHSQRVAQYSQQLAQTLGYDEEACKRIYKAGILHDIGKVATPDAILLKPEKLNDLEYTLIKEHVNVGLSILNQVPMFEDIVPIIASHHERCDGKGYPEGLKGDAIEPMARIMIVADAFDAMTTSRIYRQKKSVADAIEELKACSGTQFHPEVVEAAVKAFASLTLFDEISQLPKNALEEERFAYFYRDSLTHLHNQKYLTAILLKNSYTHFYTHVSCISLHQFTPYNQTLGWAKGDALLLLVAEALVKLFPQMLLFRIHANDFIILSRSPITINSEIQEKIKTLLPTPVTFSSCSCALLDNTITSFEALENCLFQKKPTSS